jgi:Zinc knuckle
MELDDKIALTKELIRKREEIDEQLMVLLCGEVKKKPVKCSACGESGHTARTCPGRPAAQVT